MSGMLDTYREVIMPEGVPLQLPAAGAVPRALAWLIDLAVRFGVLTLMGMLLGALGGFGQGLYLVAMFLVFWAYPIVLEGWFGQTLGKRRWACAWSRAMARRPDGWRQSPATCYAPWTCCRSATSSA